MTEKKEKEILERLLKLSDEEWQPEWGEPEALFLIDLIDSVIIHLENELDEENNRIENVKRDIEELKMELKEANQNKRAIERKLNSKRKTIQQLQSIIEGHKNDEKQMVEQ